MIRPLAVIVLAIQLSRPGIPKQEATHYAKVLQEEAKEHDFDPFSGVAIIHFESYWHPGVVSRDGEDYGLGQIRARFVSGCREDADPVNDPSPACQAAKARLLDGASNIRRMAAIITANRELCKAKHGRVLFHEWLAGYQGRNYPSQGKWCVPGEGTWRVINYRKELIAKLIPPAKPKQVQPAKSQSKAAQSKTAQAKKAQAKKSQPKKSQSAKAQPKATSDKRASGAPAARSPADEPKSATRKAPEPGKAPAKQAPKLAQRGAN